MQKKESTSAEARCKRFDHGKHGGHRHSSIESIAARAENFAPCPGGQLVR